MVRRATLFSMAILLVSGGAAEAAATLISGPVFFFSTNDMAYSVLNVSKGELATVDGES
jgi:hypothetical protein